MDLFRDWLIKYAKRKLTGILITKVPFLFSGPFGFLGTFFLDKMIVIFVDAVVLGLYDFQTEMKTARLVRRAESLIKGYREADDLTEEERRELDDTYADVAYDLIEL